MKMTVLADDAGIQKEEENDAGEVFITCQTVVKGKPGRT